MSRRTGATAQTPCPLRWGGEDVTVFENPSAGKFGPPEENADRERQRTRARKPAMKWNALVTPALLVGITLLRVFSHSRRGWAGAIAGVLVGVSYVVMYITRRQQQDAKGTGSDPYSPPTTLTR